MRVICTAGHVDHGKSTLVQAISGIHPDRLKEEIEREMTIDLGFAWMMLPDGERVGIVDVPGHEDFIDNMLAGMGGLDAALIIVAADEGIMPQTREHLAILELMGMQSAVVALTKIDMVESHEWLELVELEILELLQSTPFGSAPICRVSAHTGQGIPDLLNTLADVLQHQPTRQDNGRPVLPIDRVFTLSGFGTVVTGTLSDGTLAVGQTVEIQPGGFHARIRGLQWHEENIETAQPGSRVAVNLAGINKTDLKRGDVLSLPGFIRPTLLFDALFEHLPGAARPLRHNAEIKIFAGPAEAAARIRLLDVDELPPGQHTFVQIQLAEPLPLRNEQRFVVRIPSPSETIGGGRILDSAPGRRWRRHRPEVIERFEILASGDPVARLAYELKTRRVPQPIAALDQPELLARAREVFGLYDFNGHIVHPEAAAQLGQEVSGILEQFHHESPLLAGIDPSELLRRLHLHEDDTIVLEALAGQGMIEFDRLVRLPGKGMSFTKAQRRAIDELLSAFDAEPYLPPSYKDAVGGVGENVLKALLAQGELIFIRPDVLLRPAAYAEMIDYARQILESGKPLTVGELRDHFQTSRRVALPFLDFLESQGITRRSDEGHLLRQRNWEKVLR